MKIGIAGPFLSSELVEFLEVRYRSAPNLPKGSGGTPINLLVRGLIERGCRVTLFTTDCNITEEVILNGPQLRICVAPYRVRARDRALDLFRKERTYIRQAIEREKPDIVHAHWTYEYALGALASGAPTLITVHDWAPVILWYNRGNYRTFAYRAARFIMDWMTFKRARHLSANSQYIQQNILKRWKEDASIIPNSIEDSFLCHKEPSDPSPDVNIIAVMNGMDVLKNPMPLIRALPLIRKEIPKCRLRLVGVDYEADGKARVWAKENGLEEGCEFVGPLNRGQLIKALDGTALMIHPSLEESFGLVLIEAMAMRVPVLGGKDSGAVPWVLDGGRAGALCDVRNPESIARKAVEILTSRKRWMKLSQVGYERVRDAFSLSSVVDLCLAEYQRVFDAERKTKMQ